MRLVFGSGKIGSLFAGEDDLVISHQQCDIRDRDAVVEVIRKTQPTCVINAAANTSLESCEDNKHSAFATNTGGPINLLLGAELVGAKLVHISSGCIFDGNDRISYEDSVPNTSVWYTHTKKWADEYIVNYGYEDYLILRPRQMISAIAHPTNMLTKFAQYRVLNVHEELNSITCVEDFKEMIEHLLHNEERGIFNCCNNGAITPYEVAIGVQKYINPKMTVKKVTYEETLRLQPNRRVNTLLSNDKLRAAGFSPREATDALQWTLENYG
jgi:dTDP-4-dehydrorhamnose reductase